RLAQGEVPLWNPYNYAGHPFLADTQSAVLYPPRLLTVAVLNATGGSTPQRVYDALQKEMILHTLLASLLMYALVRRLTLAQPYSVIGSLAGGITFAYGGYMTSYPQLQLAVMEAGIWLPLALLGLHESTRHERVGWHWFGLAGVALGLSFLAGHPQTTLFFIYVSLAYLGYRVFMQRRSWRIFVLGAAVFGLVGGGLAAVQLLPGLEYTRLTARTQLTFDAMGNGFPLYDVFQVIFPGFLSLWSPLYFGIAGFGLAIYAIWRRVPGWGLWLVVAGVSLGLSFGHGTIFYDAFYNLVPGFNLFREQERSAYLIAVVAAILVGQGTVALLRPGEIPPRRFRLVPWTLVALAAVFTAGLYFNTLIAPASGTERLGWLAFSLFMSVLAALVLTTAFQQSTRFRAAAIVGLIVVELFSFGRSSPNVETRPGDSRLITPPLVTQIQKDTDGVYRVDGTALLSENYGTLYGIQDIQGISPLRLVSLDRLLKLPPAKAWEALAVRYVPTENVELPVASTIVGKQDNGPHNPINLHRLNDPRPFARLVYRIWVEPNDDQALGYFSDPGFDARHTVLLAADPGLALPATPPDDGQVIVASFKPESITVQTHSSAPALLALSQLDYPGWQATVDGQPTAILRADTALMAIATPAGDHTVQLDFRPVTYLMGSLISVLTLIVVVLGALSGLAISFRTRHPIPADR
ncbi:MAG TPA: YfhO family protein, partial [Aggregatilineales bacterium]|nr:YfhO family protein [Aggregatilineales bacterium]